MDVTGATAVAHEKTRIEYSRGRRRRDLILNGHYDDDTTDVFDSLRSVREGRIPWEDGCSTIDCVHRVSRSDMSWEECCIKEKSKFVSKLP